MTQAYPLKPQEKWRSDPQYDDGRLTWMSPDAFLSRVPSIKHSKADAKEVRKHAKKIAKGKKLKPLAIYADGEPNGRHRALAAKSLGVAKVPVLVGGTPPAKYPGKLRVKRGV